jgi:hypothetical protein
MRELLERFGDALGALDEGTTLEIDANALVVVFPSQRKQRIHVRIRDHHYVFTSRVLGSARVSELSWSELAEMVWPRNRSTPLVAFMLDEVGRLVGRIEHPSETLAPPDLRVIVLLLARECDRLEYLLTGRDEQ